MGDAERTRRLGLLALVAGTAAVLRAYYFPSVFRREDVVLIQQDPYHYRIQVERLTSRAAGVFDVSAFVDPGRDDLTVAVLGWTAELLGGGAHVVGTVLATYPVAVGVATCPVAYLAARRLTGDYRAGLVAAATLAVTPAHVYRTALGFGDHHPFDYLLLALTFLAVLGVVDSESGPGPKSRRLVTTAVLGIVLAAQTLAWNGAPLLVVPYVLFGGLLLFSVVRADESPLGTVGKLVVALLIATGLTSGAVVTLSWQSPRSVVVLGASTLLLAVLTGVVELGHRRDWEAWQTWTLSLAGLGAAGVGVWKQFTALEQTLDDGLGYFASTTGTVAEATSLFAGDESVVTVISFLGLFVLPFVPSLLWVTWRATSSHRPTWLALSTYTWYFLLLSGQQRRFAGELSLFFAVVVGVGVLSVGHTLRSGGTGQTAVAGATRWFTGTTDHRTVFVVVISATVLFATSVSVVPLTMNERVVTDGQYESAKYIERADERGWNRSYVFSTPIPNPMYNYFAHGRQVDTEYAATNYPEFAVATDAVAWYHRLSERGVGFVVLNDEYTVGDSSALHTRLTRNLGSTRGNTPGVGRFRLLFRSSEGSRTVYRPVPGAVVSGTTRANGSVRLRTPVSVPGAEFTYVRRVSVTASGHYAAVVPYPGTYAVLGSPENATTEASGSEVREGMTVGNRGPNASWSFDGTTGNGRIVVDRRGGNHGIVHDARLGDGVRDAGLRLDGGGAVVVRDSDPLDDPEGLTLTAWFRTDSGTDYVDSVPFPRLVAKAGSARFNNTDGYLLGLGNGHVVASLGDGQQAGTLWGPRVDDGRWHRATLTWNGTHCRLFLDGHARDTASCPGQPAAGRSLVVGATADRRRHFRGTIDEVCVFDRPVVRHDCGPPVPVETS